MAELFSEPSDQAFGSASLALQRRSLVVLPTETVFGIAARPDVRGATGKLFEAKARSRDLTLPILVADAATGWTVGERDARAALLAERFWPGALTIVMRRAAASAGWDLGRKSDTVGVRVPAHPVARELVRWTGPLAVTSANRSGEPTPPDCPGVQAVFGDAVEVYLCAPPAPAGTASTVVDLTTAEPRILRDGAIPPDEILETLR